MHSDISESLKEAHRNLVVQWLVVGLICTNVFSLGSTVTVTVFFSLSDSWDHSISSEKKLYWNMHRTL